MIPVRVNWSKVDTGALKMTDMKIHNMKLTDRFTGHLQGMKLQDMKMQDKNPVLTEIRPTVAYVTMKCAACGCYFLRRKHSNALCVSYYLFILEKA